MAKTTMHLQVAMLIRLGNVVSPSDHLIPSNVMFNFTCLIRVALESETSTWEKHSNLREEHSNLREKNVRPRALNRKTFTLGIVFKNGRSVSDDIII